ncbi:MAG: hypothetical protein VX834_04450, partial [Myxococcota bacterium]|nr:hypothetical protein [Myxococcota bacterium]
MKMRILTGFLFLVGLGGLAACQGAADQCTEANHCFRDDAGIPTCMEGYVWQDPDDALNLVCIGQGTAGQGGVVDGTNNGSGMTSDGTTTSGGSDNGSTGNGGAGGTGTDTDTDTDTSTTDSDGCPPNSHIGDPANGEDAQYCYCDEGFVVSADQTGCVEASGDSDGGTSDGDSSSDGGSSGNCPENAHIGVEANGEDPQYCYCDEGYSVNEAGTGCEAECEVDTDCPDGNVCIDNSCRPPP